MEFINLKPNVNLANYNYFNTHIIINVLKKYSLVINLGNLLIILSILCTVFYFVCVLLIFKICFLI